MGAYDNYIFPGAAVETICICPEYDCVEVGSRAIVDRVEGDNVVGNWRNPSDGHWNNGYIKMSHLQPVTQTIKKDDYDAKLVVMQMAFEILLHGYDSTNHPVTIKQAIVDAGNILRGGTHREILDRIKLLETQKASLETASKAFEKDKSDAKAELKKVKAELKELEDELKKLKEPRKAVDEKIKALEDKVVELDRERTLAKDEAKKIMEVRDAKHKALEALVTLPAEVTAVEETCFVCENPLPGEHKPDCKLKATIDAATAALKL